MLTLLEIDKNTENKSFSKNNNKNNKQKNIRANKVYVCSKKIETEQERDTRHMLIGVLSFAAGVLVNDLFWWWILTLSW